MVARHATGNQDRDDFMRECVAKRRGGGEPTLTLLGSGGLISGIILLAFTEGGHNERPISP